MYSLSPLHPPLFVPPMSSCSLTFYPQTTALPTSGFWLQTLLLPSWPGREGKGRVGILQVLTQRLHSNVCTCRKRTLLLRGEASRNDKASEAASVRSHWPSELGFGVSCSCGDRTEFGRTPHDKRETFQIPVLLVVSFQVDQWHKRAKSTI